MPTKQNNKITEEEVEEEYNKIYFKLLGISKNYNPKFQRLIKKIKEVE